MAYIDAIYLRRDIFHGEINVASAMNKAREETVRRNNVYLNKPVKLSGAQRFFEKYL